ncbi:MAG: hypothetical protein IJE07_02550 [Clostridia bacterium]|nr:hypothetical protein [Clostridia bacterium]
MSIHTDYTRGARRFTAWLEDGEVVYSVVASRDVPALGGEFIIYSAGEYNEDVELEAVYAARAVGATGEMADISGQTEWMVIDDMMLELEDQGAEVHLMNAELDYFQVRARGHGYDSAEEWLLAAIFGEHREDDEDEADDADE